jgi:hypothetical protein
VLLGAHPSDWFLLCICFHLTLQVLLEAGDGLVTLKRGDKDQSSGKGEAAKR